MNPLSYDGPSVLLLLLLYLVYESYNISTFKVFFMPTKDCQNSGLRTGVAKMFLATSKMLLLQLPCYNLLVVQCPNLILRQLLLN